MYAKPLRIASLLCFTALLYGCVGIDVQPNSGSASGTLDAESSDEAAESDTPAATTPPDDSSPQPANLPSDGAEAQPSVGIVWESSTNPERVNTTSSQPTFDGEDALTAKVDGIILVPVGDTTKFELACAHHVDLAVEDGDPPFASCIGMEFSLDTPADFPVDDANPEAEIKFARFVNADGSEAPIDFSLGSDPGEVNHGLVIFGGPGGAGSTLEFSIGSELAGWTDFTYVVPEESEFAPIDWDAW